MLKGLPTFADGQSVMVIFSARIAKRFTLMRGAKSWSIQSLHSLTVDNIQELLTRTERMRQDAIAYQEAGGIDGFGALLGEVDAMVELIMLKAGKEQVSG